MPRRASLGKKGKKAKIVYLLILQDLKQPSHRNPLDHVPFRHVAIELNIESAI